MLPQVEDGSAWDALVADGLKVAESVVIKASNSFEDDVTAFELGSEAVVQRNLGVIVVELQVLVLTH